MAASAALAVAGAGPNRQSRRSVRRRKTELCASRPTSREAQYLSGRLAAGREAHTWSSLAQRTRYWRIVALAQQPYRCSACRCWTKGPLLQKCVVREPHTWWRVLQPWTLDGQVRGPQGSQTCFADQSLVRSCSAISPRARVGTLRRKSARCN